MTGVWKLGVESDDSIMGKAVGNLPYLAFFVALFFADQALFGPADALLGIVFLFFSRTIIREPGLSRVNYARRCGWFFLMALCSTLAGLHPVAMVLVTMVYLFVMTIFNSDDYLPRNFFWLGLGYLLLLVNPVDVDGVGLRLLATIFSLACTSVFVWAMRWYLARTGELDVFMRDRDFVRRAFDEAAAQLRSLSTGKLDRCDPKRVFAITQEYANTEYSTVFRQGGLLSGRQGYTFSLLLAIEQVAYNTRAASLHYEKQGENEKRYYAELADVLLGFGQGRINSVKEFADELEAFIGSHEMSIAEYQESWKGILESMLRTVRDTRLSRDTTSPFLKGVAYRLYYLRDNVNLRNTQTRFALQLAIIVGIAMTVDVLLTDFIGELYGIWIPITAFTILNTYNDQTLVATRNNFIGTLAGLIVFVLLTRFLPDGLSMPVVIVVSYGVMLLDLGQPTSVAAGTLIALTALYPYMDSLRDTLFDRLFLVLLAVTCVMMIMFLLLRTQRTRTISAKIAELERIDGRLAKTLRRGLERGQVKLWRTMVLLYYLHMDAELLSQLASSLERLDAKKWDDSRRLPFNEKAKKRRAARLAADVKLADNVNRCLDLNYRFSMNAAHVVALLDPRRVDYSRWRTGTVYDDSPDRLKHLDRTFERVDAAISELEELRYLGHAQNRGKRRQS